MISQVEFTRRFAGSSTDTKPVLDMAGNMIPIASELFELDSGKIYFWNGSAWNFLPLWTST